MRATVSVVRRSSRVRRPATWVSSSSPTGWPSTSLTFLKRSRSISSTDMAWPVRVAVPTAWSRRSLNSVRLARPVSGSRNARSTMRASRCARLLRISPSAMIRPPTSSRPGVGIGPSSLPSAISRASATVSASGRVIERVISTAHNRATTTASPDSSSTYTRLLACCTRMLEMVALACADFTATNASSASSMSLSAGSVSLIMIGRADFRSSSTSSTVCWNAASKRPRVPIRRSTTTASSTACASARSCDSAAFCSANSVSISA